MSAIVIDRSLAIHKALGPGLLESVYQRILTYELRKAGLSIESEVKIPLEWDGNIIDESFRADIIANNQVLIELKSVKQLEDVHKKQTLTYLKLSKLTLGLLINFGSPLLKNGIHRIANNYKE